MQGTIHHPHTADHVSLIDASLYECVRRDGVFTTWPGEWRAEQDSWECRPHTFGFPVGAPTYISGSDYAGDQIPRINPVVEQPTPERPQIPAQTPTNDPVNPMQPYYIADPDRIGMYQVISGANVWGGLTLAQAKNIVQRELLKTPQTGAIVQEDEPVSIINDILGGVQQVANIYSTVANPGAQPNIPVGIMPTPAVGIPFVDVIPEQSGRGMVWSPRANCGNGGWIKRRRRRRQLLSESDYNALLRIETLKVNKNMTMAIGKALTR